MHVPCVCGFGYQISYFTSSVYMQSTLIGGEGMVGIMRCDGIRKGAIRNGGLYKRRQGKKAWL